MTIPDFPIVAHERVEGVGVGVVVRGRGTKVEVTSVAPEARRLGVRPGMALTEAKARVPHLTVWLWDEALYARAESECAAALLAASPRIARADGGAFWLEVGDWARCGGERAFAEVARGAVLALGYPAVQIGIADSAVTAWAASRLAGKPVVRVPPGRDAEFLEPLPVRALTISETLLEWLAALGVERVADLVRLGSRAGGPAAVEARLGAEGLRAWRWAQGRDGRRPFRRHDERAREVFVELGGPVTTLEPFLFVLRACLDRLAADLGRRGECARALEIVLGCEDGSEVVRRLTPARPTRDARVYLDLARATLEGVRLPAPAHELTVRTDAAVPAGAEQGDLFERRWVDPLTWSVGHARLVARWGAAAVVRAEPHDSHRPEAGGCWVPVRPTEPSDRAKRSAAGAVPSSSSSKPAILPTLLLHLLADPAEIAVRLEDGRPGAVRMQDRWSRVSACVGPERLSGEWWGDTYRREYYRVLAAGGWHWIFRDARDDIWKLHGWWD